MEERRLTFEELLALAKGEELPEEPKDVPQEDDNARILREMVEQGQRKQRELEEKEREEARKRPPIPVSEVLRNNGTRDSNIERTGKRDMTLSRNARPIGTGTDSLDTIRNWDLDLCQVCSRCNRTYIFMESSADPKRASSYTRALAEDVAHRAWAMLIIHHPNDLEGQKPIKRLICWEKGRKVICDKTNVRWDDWRKGMESLAKEHAKYCRPRKRFE